MNAYALPGLDLHLRAPYDDAPEPIKPTSEQYHEAFDRCVEDAELLSEYVFDSSAAQPAGDPITLLQLVHAGLPREADKSELADARRDMYAGARDAFFDGFRAWLGKRLDKEALRVAEEEAEQARRDAEEARAA